MSSLHLMNELLTRNYQSRELPNVHSLAAKTLPHIFKHAARLYLLTITIDWLLLRNCFWKQDSLHDNNYVSCNTIRQLSINNFNSDTKKPHTTFTRHFIVKTLRAFNKPAARPLFPINNRPYECYYIVHGY